MSVDDSFKFKVCGCKGIRSCLLCEVKIGDNKPNRIDTNPACIFSYCHKCDKAWPSQDSYSNRHPVHKGNPLDIPGVLLVPDFITEAEECSLVENIDRIPWILSQSGRRKQDFGPGVNFKKKKVKTATFQGLPHFASRLIERISLVPKLKDFRVVELCHLEYVPERGSAIDPHIDDVWLWGEHLVTVNLLSDTVLTLSPIVTKSNNELSDSSKNGLCCRNSIQDYPVNIMDERHTLNISNSKNETKELSGCFFPEVKVPLPQRSLLVLYGSARYSWTHAILRQNIQARRIAMTFRELSSNFMEGGNEETIGKELLEIAGNWLHMK